MRRCIVIMALSLAMVGAVAGEVYKWTGPDGRIQFGDRPPPEVQPEQLRIRSFTGPVEVNADASAPPGVVMLSAVWCGVCKQARQYLTTKGILFTEHDVEKSETGRSEYKRLNGRSVPIFLVGGQRMNGFSAERLDQLLERK